MWGKGRGKRNTRRNTGPKGKTRQRGNTGEGEINNCNPKDTEERETSNIENKTARESREERTGVAVSSAPGF